MLRHARFHLHLHSPVLRIHIVKQFLARLAQIRLHIVIQILRYMHRRRYPTQPQTQVIEARVLIVFIHLSCHLLQSRNTHQYSTTEIKIIPQRTYLPVDNRCRLRIKMITVHHHRLCILTHLHHPLQTEQHPLHLFAQQNQTPFATRLSSNLFNLCGRTNTTRKHKSIHISEFWCKNSNNFAHIQKKL